MLNPEDSSSWSLVYNNQRQLVSGVKPQLLSICSTNREAWATSSSMIQRQCCKVPSWPDFPGGFPVYFLKVFLGCYFTYALILKIIFYFDILFLLYFINF